MNREQVRVLIRKEAIHQWRKYRFFHNDTILKLGWTFDDFAKKNGLDRQEANSRQKFDLLRAMAERDIERISSAVMRGKIRYIRVVASYVIPHVDLGTCRVECDAIKK